MKCVVANVARELPSYSMAFGFYFVEKDNSHEPHPLTWLSDSPGYPKSEIVMDIIIKRHGRFELIQNAKGFCWCLTASDGEKWYWHPKMRRWTYHCQSNPTEEAATADLDWTLSHEDAGDLDQQHITPPIIHKGSPMDCRGEPRQHDHGIVY